MTATLVCQNARIDLAGVPLLEGLTLESHAERLALLGAWSPLFQLALGEAVLSQGDLKVLDLPLVPALRSGKLGVACLDPPLPAKWRVLDYLRESARLGGVGRGQASRLARARLRDHGLEALVPRSLQNLSRAERRCLQIVRAVLLQPELLMIEAPLSDLDAHGQALVAETLERAAAGRRSIVSVRDAHAETLERRLLDSAQELIVLTRGEVVLQTDRMPAVSTERYTVSLLRNGGPLAEVLRAEGYGVETSDEAPEAFRATGSAGAAFRLLITLPEPRSARDIVQHALEHDAPIVELVPLPGRSTA